MYAAIISTMPTRIPGKMPPISRPPIEMPSCAPMITSGIDGGMIAPTTEAEATIAPANSRGYFSLIMLGIMIGAMVAASDSVEPVIPESSMLAVTVTCARPPRIQPTSRRQNSISLSVSSQRLSSSPARTKVGSASSAKESTAPYISLASTVVGIRVPENRRKIAQASERLNAIGTPRARSTRKGRNSQIPTRSTASLASRRGALDACLRAAGVVQGKVPVAPEILEVAPAPASNVLERAAQREQRHQASADWHRELDPARTDAARLRPNVDRAEHPLHAVPGDQTHRDRRGELGEDDEAGPEPERQPPDQHRDLDVVPAPHDRRRADEHHPDEAPRRHLLR